MQSWANLVLSGIKQLLSLPNHMNLETKNAWDGIMLGIIFMQDKEMPGHAKHG
jgi:hypothetical protein